MIQNCHKIALFHKFDMKVFKFPSTTISNQDIIKTAKHRNQERQESRKSPQQNLCKKSNSIDFSYFHSRKLQEIEKAYRNSSSDKKIRNKSLSSTKSTNDLKVGLKSGFSTMLSNKKPYLKNQKRIFLKTEQKGKYIENELKSCIQLMCDKLAKCLEAKSERFFVEQYGKSIAGQQKIDSKQSDCDLVNSLVALIQKCQERKIEKKVSGLNDKAKILEKHKIDLQIQVKKVQTKYEVCREQMKKVVDKNFQLSTQIKRIKQKICMNQSVQTELKDKNQCLNDKNLTHQMQTQFPKLIQQLRALKQRDNHMTILINQLQKQGVDLEKVYKKAIKYKQNQQASSSSRSSLESQRYPAHIKQKEKINNSTGQAQSQKGQNCDADISIVDQMDALSFNFEDKENEMEAYTPRRVYVCQKKMDEQLKKKLQLNFGCLYEWQSGQQSQKTQAFPTI